MDIEALDDFHALELRLEHGEPSPLCRDRQPVQDLIAGHDAVLAAQV
jgi:hypothetical protein